MKHKKTGRTLGKKPQRREALLKNLTASLLEHGAIVTTQAKAKELKRHVDKLLTVAAGEGSLHQRRLLLRKVQHKKTVEQLKERAVKKVAGSRVRLTKMPTQRSDGAKMTRIEFIKY